MGDAAFQQKCIDRIKDVFSGDRTLSVGVTFRRNGQRSLCQRTIWINAGTIVDGWLHGPRSYLPTPNSRDQKQARVNWRRLRPRRRQARR